MKYEIEIKSLLGSKEKADFLKSKMLESDPDTHVTTHSKQLNHYFINGDFESLRENIDRNIPDQEKKERLKTILKEGKSHSVRTRKLNEDVLLVIKASVDDSTSSNGISRMEFEEKLPLTLDELDEILLQSGFEYQAKWSREREEYKFKDINICLDKNAGYGYVAEFEKIIDNIDTIEDSKREIKNIMREMQVEELAQDRLERMFAHYNENWRKYYGTDNIFTLE